MLASPSRRCPGIANRAAAFEGSPNRAKDPALLSVAERKALFEKNKGDVVIPKPAFVAKKLPAPKPPVQTKAVIETGSGIASKMAALLENKTTISQAQIESGVKQQRQKEMNALMSRFNKNKDVKDVDSEDEDQVDETSAMIKENKSVKIVKPPLPPVGPQTSAAKRLSELTSRFKILFLIIHV